ncbi:3-phosphoserine/phosphohydroxythreonine transaminase [Natronogracilivirga saccharolytica]|uniref:Phosphoserine aminotransferase n=1 Tax=Natronogracilivirga saccharolytica TaxID=2812953 RepID=A0A8J7RP69_9BACT|nr:3-phosphoserine/phosphohydroxythreonine transaminase [Natronogracilivirga saccharolytica]MBP3193369.1 3-phosphoserine/phosphohydroxythreonine transaminase [Natronogracilivirga saccharolytica]
MKQKRAHNFSAGPAALPLEVLQKAQEELVDYQGAGASIIEMSHRGPEYTEVDRQARERLSRLLGLGDDYEILFYQGGASLQFLMVPYNFNTGKTADYINTGTWSKKAIKEAKVFGDVHIAFSSEDSNFNRVPGDEELNFSGKGEYVHFTSNNTIFGTQFRNEPASDGLPLACDASSDFLSRPVDINRYGVLYAGAQKNAGPAGLTIVILRKDMLEKARSENVSSMLSYPTQVGTLFNTPPVFGVYIFNYVLEWIESKGGLEAMDRLNQQKAGILYDEIDRDDFYAGTADKASRSLMNVTFRLKDEALEKTFIEESKKAGMSGLKGHRSVGGMRASIYNACPQASVEALVEFMQEFRRTHG